ncbi:hypothetical protein Z043_124323 [Scleropages formosus]|uniref:Claudin n=1 Tax=Scleropages formosus TaxID=113540 RepID=A0A0P7TK13_SCLFO|nr:hypothetical protein Z043_124323 [Scleropages formosus]
MASMGIQILGLTIAIVGFLGVIIMCALPMWKVTAFIGANIVTAQTTWQGLWMTCVLMSTKGQQIKLCQALPGKISGYQRGIRVININSLLNGLTRVRVQLFLLKR